MEWGALLGDRYRLGDRIAAGGMGEVWRAVDERLGRTVAIKVLHPELAGDPGFRARFLLEARTVAALHAPGVVKLHDAVEESTSDGRVLSYLVMEFVDGKSLGELLSLYGRLTPEEALPFVMRTAEALDAVHRAGIVHRDVKPDNIRVGRDARVTLVDFGIAHATGDPRLTATGMVIGTVSYASPEQLLDRELTGLSDVYSLGAVAYECLAGEPPFTGVNAAAIIAGVLHDAPRPLPADVPRAVADVVMRALAKDPAERWRGAGEFGRACRRVLAEVRAGTSHAPAAEVRPRPEEPGRTMPLPAPPRRRGRALTITVVTAVLALLGGLAAWIGPFGGKEDGGAANPTDGSSVPESPGPSTETDGGATDPRIPDGTTSMLRSGATYEDVAFCLYTSDNLVEDEGYDNVLGWDCDDTDEEFTFVASEDDPDVYRITTESNGCVLGDPDAEEHYDTVLRYEDCPDDPFAWRVKVLSVEEGELTVEIEHIGSERCLTVDEAHMSAHKPYVVLDTCAGTEHQEWTAEVD